MVGDPCHVDVDVGPAAGSRVGGAVHPPWAISVAAVWCAQAGLRQSREQASGHAPAVAAAVVAYVVLGLCTALFLLLVSTMGMGG